MSNGEPAFSAQNGSFVFPGIAIAVLVLSGWAYLIAMVADMVPVMDMTEAGPGMGLLNRFNLFAGLSEEARAALAVLCLPGQVATFGMPAADWVAIDFAKVFLMWVMMALAMMLPSALPMLRSYVRRAPPAASRAEVNSASLQIIFGYLAVWFAYASVATIVQWAVFEAGMVSEMMAPVSLVFAGTTLVAAGVYQFTPAKYACLTRCWFPNWVFAERSDRLLWPHAFKEGFVQGLACLGCCWAIMTVMFAVGIMNVIWIAVLGAIMAIEKNWPNPSLRFLIGGFFLIWGGMLLMLATGVGS